MAIKGRKVEYKCTKCKYRVEYIPASNITMCPKCGAVMEKIE